MSRKLFAAIALAGTLASPRTGFAQIELSPEEAIARALRENPSLAAAVADRRGAGWAVVGEDAEFAPTLRLDLGLSHTDQPVVTESGGTTRASLDSLGLAATVSKRLRLGTDLALSLEHNRRWQNGGDGGFVAVGPVFDTSARLELTQPLLRGAGASVTEAALRAARLQETEAERTAERVASELVRDVLQAWWELWYAEEAVAIERAALELAERQRDEAQRRVELGAEAPVEVLSFETRVAERLEGLAAAERDRQERALALAALLGDDTLDVAAAAPTAAPPALPPAEEARQRAIEYSPAVREAEASLRLAALQAETAADPYRPRLDLQGYAEAGNPSQAFIGFGNESELVWTAGVNLIFELPLTGRRHEAARQQARLAVESAERRLEQARLTAGRTVEAELARVASAGQRVELARRTVELAEAQLRAATRRYEIGSGTPIEILEAEDAVRAARLRLARAEVDRQSAGAAVEHLTGALLARWASAVAGGGS